METSSNQNPTRSKNRLVRRIRRWFRKVTGQSSGRVHRSRSLQHAQSTEEKPISKVERQSKHNQSYIYRLFRPVRHWYRKQTGKSSGRVSSRSTSSRSIPPIPISVVESSGKREGSLSVARIIRRLKRRLRRLTGVSSSRSGSQRTSSQLGGAKPASSSERSTAAKSGGLSRIYRRIKRRIRKLSGKSEPVHRHHRSSSPVIQPIIIDKPKEAELDYFPYFVNSTMMFMLAYLVAYLTHQFAVIVSAAFFHIDSVLFYYEVMFPCGVLSRLWTVANIILITLSGPLVSLITGMLYLEFVIRRKRVRGNVLMFFNWLVIHSFCMFFAAFVAGAITWRGFGYAINWSNLPIFMRIMVSAIFLFLLSFLGYLGTRFILETTNSIDRVRTKKRKIFLLNQTLLPWVFGTALLAGIKYTSLKPQHNNILAYDLIIIFGVLFMIVPQFFNTRVRPNLNETKMNRNRTEISIWGIFITLVSFLIFRFVLDYGLHIFLHFSVDLSWWRG